MLLLSVAMGNIRNTEFGIKEVLRNVICLGREIDISVAIVALVAPFPVQGSQIVSRVQSFGATQAPLN